jgi:muramidase (phage lysozyme)
MSQGAGAALLVLAAGAAALLYMASQNNGNTDVSGFTPSDALGQAEGGILDITNFNGPTGDPATNRQAFLDMIAQSEVGAALLAETDNGYNVLVGATASNPMTFDDYSTHPDVLNSALNSTAAGRYQINFPTFQTLSRQTGLTDFSPATQDAMALQLAANKGALADIDAGNISAAIAKCKGVWASFAGATYGQHTNSLDSMLAWFQNAGGSLVS